MKKILAVILCFLPTASFAGVSANSIEQQTQRAFALLQENLTLSKLPAGAVIASPSQSNPNYYYHWLRDAGITMREVVRIYETSNNITVREKVKKQLLNWLAFEEKNQNTARTSSNLGEPIFTVDGGIYPHPWGRPQNDGPAIRALALIEWSEILIREGEKDLVDRMYRAHWPANSIIKTDLEYVAHHWQELCFDLWEEVKGEHFFTLLAQRAALVKGALLAEKLKDNSAAEFYRKQAKAIEARVAKHWDPIKQITVPTLNQSDGWTHKASGLDVSVILGSIYFSLGDGFFTPESMEIQKTAKELMKSFIKLYPINSRSLPAVAIGRYPEDIYNGTGFSLGNPWFLATHAFAELNCRTAVKTNRDDLQIAGEQFLVRSILHVDEEGRMAEQLNRESGYQQGARDLTWSYSSFLRAASACGYANPKQLKR